MKVINMRKEKVITYYVETDEKEYPLYERTGSGNWFRQMGESLEPVFNDEELEAAFNIYSINTGIKHV